MRDSYISVYYHVVFSTKDRQRTITQEVANRLYPYLSASFKNHGATTIRINGMPDHIHILFHLNSANINLSDLIREIKKSSNKFINETLGFNGRFKWQAGYSCFSVGRREVPAIISYIETQQQHHTRMGFEEEWAIIVSRMD